MITLQQAIDLATKAHEGQWRNPINERISNKEYWENGIHNWLDSFDNAKFNSTKILENGLKVNWCYTSRTLSKQHPYITHPLAVMDMMSTEEEKIVAVLHDVLENTSMTYQYLYDKCLYSVSDTARNALKLLAKTSEQSYELYIFNISCCRIARKIKLADILHNLSDSPSEHTKQNYLKAIPILLRNI